MDGISFENKKCKTCGEEIQFDVRRCPYCGSSTTSQEKTVLEANVDSVKDSIDEEFLQEPMDVIKTDKLEDVKVIQNSNENNFKTEQKDKVDTVEIPIVKKTVKYSPYVPANTLKPLSNGFKVFITTLAALLPGLGQLIGVIAAIVFMNSEEDKDRRAFGLALLFSSIIAFIISSVTWFVVILAMASDITF